LMNALDPAAGGRLLAQERRGAHTSVVVPVLPPDRL
jgi:hypothetical protein